MQSDSRFRAKNAGHGLIDSSERQTARICRFLECCQRRVGHGRLQKQIHSGEKCLHGSFAGSEVPGDASHIHCVSDYEAIEAEFITEQAADNSRRECRRSASFGLERRHGQVPGHYRACSGCKGRAKRRQFHRVEMSAVVR